MGAPLPEPTRTRRSPPAGSTDTVVQYVQGTGDPWGEMRDVEAIVDATPTRPVIRYQSAGATRATATSTRKSLT